jgi:hypothetical protein
MWTEAATNTSLLFSLLLKLLCVLTDKIIPTSRVCEGAAKREKTKRAVTVAGCMHQPQISVESGAPSGRQLPSLIVLLLPV